MSVRDERLKEFLLPYEQLDHFDFGGHPEQECKRSKRR
jgi:hypothetical protein